MNAAEFLDGKQVPADKVCNIEDRDWYRSDYVVELLDEALAAHDKLKE